MTLRLLFVGAVVFVVAACGGSGSETPPPIEPTSPRATSWQHQRPGVSEGDTSADGQDESNADQEGLLPR